MTIDIFLLICTSLNVERTPATTAAAANQVLMDVKFLRLLDTHTRRFAALVDLIELCRLLSTPPDLIRRTGRAHCARARAGAFTDQLQTKQV